MIAKTHEQQPARAIENVNADRRQEEALVADLLTQAEDVGGSWHKQELRGQDPRARPAHVALPKQVSFRRHTALT